MILLNSLSEKQKEYWNTCDKHRWSIKCGATRSGKTFLDYYLIPKRIRAVSGQDGLNVILGNTKSTLQRNIIEPLQNIWGVELVGDIKNDNTSTMFGEKVHCIGADKINQVNRLRGSSIKYCYGDEVATWHEEVFNMLKSRLDKEYSRFDGTCNPDSPRHWFKKFLDSDADIFCQNYSLHDNPFLPQEFVKNLELEYKGTVYFDRYILGFWKRAEGIVFPDFADNPQNYYADKIPQNFRWCSVGYDLGGNKSHYGLVASALGYDNVLYVLKAEEILPQEMKSSDVENKAKAFIESVEKKYNTRVENAYIDDAYYTIINGLNSWRYMFGNAAAIKSAMPLIDRPIKLNKLMNTGRFKIVEKDCKPLIEQLQDAVYSDKVEGTICDDGTQCIDVIDAFFYSIADEYPFLTD